jgi:rhodanese-related sulfurtransferase
VASNDAVEWNKLQVFDAIEGHAVDGERIVRRRAVDPNSITHLGEGEYVAICSIGNRSSGGRARVLELYEVYLAEDGKTLTRKSRKILGNGPSGAHDEEELDGATTVLIGNTWHMIYVGTRGKAGENTIMGAVGRLDKSAPRSPPLPREERTRDFHRK